MKFHLPSINQFSGVNLLLVSLQDLPGVLGFLSPQKKERRVRDEKRSQGRKPVA